MRLGVCARPEQLAIVERAGADYIECTVTGINNLSDIVLKDFAEQLQKSRIRCEALAILFPGVTIPLTGLSADHDAAKMYLEKSFKRISLLSPKIVVFGSGGARRYPDGFQKPDAFAQLVSLGRMMADAASVWDINIALEPLNQSETNIINSLAEGLKMVQAVDKPNFKLLADFYHMIKDDEPAEAILPCKDAIIHTHIAAKLGRVCPGSSDTEMFKSYFDALHQIEYNGSMSIEASFTDMERELPEALAWLRTFER